MYRPRATWTSSFYTIIIVLSGHYSKMCRTRTINQLAQESEENSETDLDEFYIGAVTNRQEEKLEHWKVNIPVNSTPITFKIDTGADCSVISWNDFSKLKKVKLMTTKAKLYGPGRKSLDIVGKIKVDLEWGNQIAVHTLYVTCPRGSYESLIGLPAIKSLKLISGPTVSVNKRAGINTIRSTSNSLDIVSQYPKLFSGIGQLQKPYHIELDPNAIPYAISCPRRIPIPLKKKVKEELCRLVSEGIIEQIEEPTDWCAGMVPVPKPGGKVRICVDLQKLNKNIKRERFILPKVEESLALIGEGAKLFSKLDASCGFWQIPLTQDSAKLTSFLTPFGRFFFKKLPMGIASAPEHYERRVRQTLEGLEGVVSMQDDVLIFGRNTDEHDRRLYDVLDRLLKAGITLNKEKCIFRAESVKFLGNIVSSKGIGVDPSKVEAIVKFKTPQNVSDLRSFLGLAMQLAKFVKNISEITKPLRDLLVKNNEWTWGDPQMKALQKLKEILTNPPILALFDPNLETRVTSDACKYGIGGLLEQKQVDGDWRPVSYCSRSLSETEQRYATLEKEALAATWVSERFSDYLTGLRYTIVVDHKPLLSLLGDRDLDKLTARIQRFRMRLMRFNYVIRYEPGKTLLSADALSRYPVGHPQNSDLTFEKNLEAQVSRITLEVNCSDQNIQRIRSAQSTDPITFAVKQCIAEGWSPSSQTNPMTSQFFKHRESLANLDGLLVYSKRLFVPASIRQEMLGKIHCGHLGIEKCRRRARLSLWWPNISRDIVDFIGNCQICLQHRTNHVEPMIPTDLPVNAWSEIGADVCYLNGKNFVLLQDYFSRYPEVVYVSSISAKNVIQACKSVFSRLGVPIDMRADAGTQFTSAEFRKFAGEWGMNVHIVSPKHSRGNGLAEAAAKSVKRILQSSEDPYQGLLAYRTSPLESGKSPAELLMGRQLRTNLPQLDYRQTTNLEEFRQKESLLKQRQKRNFDRRHNAKELEPVEEGRKAWISDLKRFGEVISAAAHPRSYKVDTGKRIVQRNRAHLIAAKRRSTMVPPAETDSPPLRRSTSNPKSPPQTLSKDESRPKTLDDLPKSKIDSPEKPGNSPNPDNPSPNTITTRSGRVVNQPKRLVLH